MSVNTSSSVLPFRFTDLPGELRNRAYKILIDSEVFNCILVSFDNPSEPNSCLLSIDDEEKGLTKPQFYNLTKVSRMMRAEFLPLYQQALAYMVDFEQLPHYLSTDNIYKARQPEPLTFVHRTRICDMEIAAILQVDWKSLPRNNDNDNKHISAYLRADSVSLKAAFIGSITWRKQITSQLQIRIPRMVLLKTTDRIQWRVLFTPDLVTLVNEDMSFEEAVPATQKIRAELYLWIDAAVIDKPNTLKYLKRKT